MAEKPLTADEKAVAKEIFDALDQDGDGAIDHDDMKKALANAGYRMEDAEIDVSHKAYNYESIVLIRKCINNLFILR